VNGRDARSSVVGQWEAAMIANMNRANVGFGRRGVASVASLGLVVGAFGLSGCSVVQKVKTVAHDVRANKATMDTFTNKIKTGEGATFEATYVTTGTSPRSVVYAVAPPKGLTFTDSPTTGANAGVPSIDIIVNSDGEYSCTPPAAGASGVWACTSLPAEDAASQNAIFAFYTPAHWVTFLQGFSLAAGFAGESVTSSTMTVNGFDMSCVNFQASGDAEKSTICTTAQGILGYVKVEGDTTSFEIKSYSSSPPASLFALPPGAKVTAATLPSAAASS
jgi:hypothetical protein